MVTSNDSNNGFKVGDKVRSPVLGDGVVTEVDDTECDYPITVKWTKGSLYADTHSLFTLQGHYYVDGTETENDIYLLAAEEEEKVMANDEKFKVGDRVYYPGYGLGSVIANHNDGRPYPIDVKWDKSPKGHEVRTFTKDGFLVVSLGDCGDNDKLTVVGKAEEEKKARVSSKSKEEVGQITHSAINPSRYRVKGIPKAYDLMTHLMHREQLEGFYFCNIIKYVYRYGREGDKAEIAEKIKWNAQKLKELGECESNET